MEAKQKRKSKSVINSSHPFGSKKKNTEAAVHHTQEGRRGGRAPTGLYGRIEGTEQGEQQKGSIRLY